MREMPCNHIVPVLSIEERVDVGAGKDERVPGNLLQRNRSRLGPGGRGRKGFLKEAMLRCAGRAGKNTLADPPDKRCGAVG